ncbi:MAG: glycosyltransferase family 2 protein [Granulosicoccus sp.]
MKYSLIIPAWNEAEFLPMTLQSINATIKQLEAQSVHRGELIVVDNNSTDNTADIARANGATVVFEEINQIARARNRGAKSAQGDALVFLDADSQCSVQLLNYVLDLLEEGGTVGGGALIAPDKPIAGAALRALKLWNRIAIKGKFAAGCFVYCRKTAFDDVGGFDTRVYAAEEIYLSRALKKWGRRRSQQFHIATLEPVVTSVRKLEWYTSAQIVRQALMVLIPGAVYSKRLCKTWYDNGSRKKR